MKIAMPADGMDLEANLGHKFGTSPYLIIVDAITMSFEAIPNPGAHARSGSGMSAVAMMIDKKVDLVLIGYCSPAAQGYLSANGIETLTGVSGKVGEVVQKAKKGKMQNVLNLRRTFPLPEKSDLYHALGNACNQFVNLLPILIGVILLIGLFNAFVSKEIISLIFSKSKALDTILGSCLGSIFAGNPMNSYVIGGELIERGVSLFAVTAFMSAWVTVGLIQLPAEMATLGKRFALVRNAIAFILSLGVAYATVLLLKLVTG
ncbi:NifB/NifX family molybdenum-iron cluster-binding protein [Thermodesulfobacteriota bacterium]